MRIRLLLALSAVLLALACATGPGFVRDQSTYHYRIESSNWEIATILFQCDGRIVKRVTNVHLGEIKRGAVNMTACTRKLFAITFLARNDVFVGEDLGGWTEDSTLVIMIENHLPQTTYRVELAPRT